MQPYFSSMFLWLLIIPRQKIISSGGLKTHEAFERLSLGCRARVGEVDGRISGEGDRPAVFQLTKRAVEICIK